MAGLKLMSQGGYNPKIATHLLDDATGQRAINTKVYSGDLRSWFKPKAVEPVFSCIPGGETIYLGLDNNGDDRWIVWDTPVWVAKSPILDETENLQIYYAENLVLKKTNSTLAGDSSFNGEPPDEWYYAGIPAPTSALTATEVHVSSSGTPEDRVYVYTFVDEFGSIESESAPSAASNTVTVHPTCSVNLTGFQNPTAFPNRNITKIRIYRSVTSAGGDPTFLFVAEIAASLVATPGYTFNDNIYVANLGEALPSLTWVEPPNMTGVVFHPGGFLVGWHNREIIISEVNAPFAYPIQYRQTIDFDIVGMGVFGSSIAIMTKGYPYIMSGNLPEAMTPEKLATLEPCISARSITSDDAGVMYASPNGICMIGAGAGGLATGNLFTKDEFSAFNPATIRSAVYNGKYFAFYKQGSQKPLPNGGVILDRAIPSNPLSLTSAIASACYVNPETSNMYYLDGTTIYKWEGDIFNNFPFEWLSKTFIFDMPTNFGAVEIGGDFASVSSSEQAAESRQEIINANIALWNTGAPLNGALNDTTLNHFDINGSILENVPSLIDDRFVQFTLYAEKDGVMNEVYNTVYLANGVYRLPSGLKAQKFEIKLAGNLELRYIKMASTAKELARLE